MAINEVISQVEAQAAKLEVARAVLQAAHEEVEEYAKYQRIRGAHTAHLLHAADGILFDISKALDSIIMTKPLPG